MGLLTLFSKIPAGSAPIPDGTAVRQYLVVGSGYFNEVTPARQFLSPGGNYINAKGQ